MRKIQNNIFRFRIQPLIIIGVVVYLMLSLWLCTQMIKSDVHQYQFWGVILIPLQLYLFVVLLRVYLTGVVLDLNTQVLKFSPNFFISIFKPVGKLKQKTVNLDEITGIALNQELHIDSDNKITQFFSVNITGTFGAKNIQFLTFNDAQNLYQMLSAACNLA